MVYINNNLYSVEITTTERRRFENSFFFFPYFLFKCQMQQLETTDTYKFIFTICKNI